MLPKAQRPLGFPSCISLDVSFNEHAVYYQTVEQWESSERESGRDVAWVSEDERRLAIEADSVWSCHWYPDTPVGSCELVASSFEALMRAVNEV